jgi:phosphatidylserine decarboxylase
LPKPSDLLEGVVVPIHRAGWPFIAAALVMAVLLYAIWTPLVVPGVVLALFVTYFFRNPDRVVPARAGLVVSPADGRIIAVAQASPPPELGMAADPVTRVSIFLNIFDVHVNRVPAEGSISALAYHKGKFVNAALDKASEDNERQAVRLTMPDGKEIAFVQIAGLIARRIVCNLSQGQSVKTGERFGLIRFGSRAEVYLPEGVSALVAPGQRAIGGETVIADLNSDEGPRQGERR